MQGFSAFKTSSSFTSLLYHHVGPRGVVAPSLSIRPAQFAAHLAWLRRHGFTTPSIDDIARGYAGGRKLPDRSVLITFDDGYRDIGIHALPAVVAHGFRAIVFVPSALVGRANKWDREAGMPRAALLTANQMAHWVTQGIEFGSHTRSHRDLSACRKTDEADRASEWLERELLQSADEIEAITGRPCLAFAYPWGRHTPAAVTLVRRRYALAFTVEDGVNGGESDPCLLGRAMIQPGEMLAEFGLRVRDGRNPLLKLRVSGARARAWLGGR